MNPDGVHLWQARLSAAPSALKELRQSTPGDVVKRAGSVRLESARDRYAASRIFLRAILSLYLGIEARDVSVGPGPFGGPGLAGVDLEFDLAHSEGLALLAVANGEGRRNRRGTHVPRPALLGDRQTLLRPRRVRGLGSDSLRSSSRGVPWDVDEEGGIAEGSRYRQCCPSEGVRRLDIFV